MGSRLRSLGERYAGVSPLQSNGRNSQTALSQHYVSLCKLSSALPSNKVLSASARAHTWVLTSIGGLTTVLSCFLQSEQLPQALLLGKHPVHIHSPSSTYWCSLLLPRL